MKRSSIYFLVGWAGCMAAGTGADNARQAIAHSIAFSIVYWSGIGIYLLIKKLK